MPSPFPGMDPFIEAQAWDDFQLGFVVNLAATLVPVVRPRYAVRIGRRTYLDRTKSATKPDEQHEAFVTIRERDSRKAVTVIELLSPCNKRSGSDGYREYSHNRDVILSSSVNLIELDLVRGGERIHTAERLPRCDFLASVAPWQRRPKRLVWPWLLRDSLPKIPVPLRIGDVDVLIDLQQVFTDTYDRSGYDYSLDYDMPVDPALDESDAAWVASILKERKP